MAQGNPENNGPDLDDDVVEEQTQQQGVNLSDAWNPLLEILPEEFHTLAAPTLQQWDKNYQETVNGLQAELNQYKNWDEFVENEVDPNQAKAALQFAVMLEDNPKETLEGLAKHFDIDIGSAQGTDDDDDDYDPDDDDEDITNHPLVQKLIENQQELQEQFQSRQQEDAVAELEQQLDEYLDELHEEHGDFNEPFVLSLFQQGYEMEDAVEYFKSAFPGWVDPDREDDSTEQAPANSQSSFVPMGNGGSSVGGGVPVQPSNNYGKMGTRDINEFVAQLAAGLNDES